MHRISGPSRDGYRSQHIIAEGAISIIFPGIEKDFAAWLLRQRGRSRDGWKRGMTSYSARNEVAYTRKTFLHSPFSRGWTDRGMYIIGRMSPIQDAEAMT